MKFDNSLCKDKGFGSDCGDQGDEELFLLLGVVSPAEGDNNKPLRDHYGFDALYFLEIAQTQRKYMFELVLTIWDLLSLIDGPG